MRKLLLSICCLGCALWAQAKDFTQYVNPLMGTLSSFELSTGNTYPAIARPWGMNFWTPQTGKMGDGWQYVYTANKIRGFKQTHQPSPWINDYGQFSIMPVTGKPEFDEDKRASWFSHKGEIALPYYYTVECGWNLKDQFAQSCPSLSLSIPDGQAFFYAKRRLKQPPFYVFSFVWPHRRSARINRRP